MPAYIHSFDIDWGWEWLSEKERTVARRHQARANADPGAHTLSTLMDALANASKELGGRQIPARAEDEHGSYLLLANGGTCSQTEDDLFNEDGRFPGVLSAEDYRAAGVTNIYLGLFWPEETLEDLIEAAARSDQSLSALVQFAWLTAKNPATSQEGNYPLRSGGTRRRQSIYLPIDIYEELMARAAEEDCSPSTLVQKAVAHAWPTIKALPTAE